MGNITIAQLAKNRQMAQYRPLQNKINSILPESSENKKEETADTNVGGFLGGVGYLGHKVGLGALGWFEGIADYTAGGLAKMFGNDEWAEKVFANDWVNYNSADEWYNPDENWAVAGDVAQGIGNSLPSVALSIGLGIATGGASVAAQAALQRITTFFTAGLSAAGMATKEAYQQTGKLGAEEFAYGAMQGAMEGTIETVTDNVLGWGTGVAKKAFGRNLATKVTRDTLGKSLIKGFTGEAVEEGISAYFSPYIKRATYDPNAKNASMQEIGYSAFIGGLSGMIMGGGAGSVNLAINASRGNTLATEGKTESVINLAENISNFESKNKSENEAFEAVSSALDELKTSLAKTGGEVTTVKQRMLLGYLDRANTVAFFQPYIVKAATNIANNPDAVAETINKYYANTATGEKVSISAEDLKAGIDFSSQKAYRKSLTKALKKNSALRTLTVLQVAGRLGMNTETFSNDVSSGNFNSYVTQTNINDFREKATPREMEAVSEALGIGLDEWDDLTPEVFSARMDEFNNSGKVEEIKKRNAKRKELLNISEAEAKEKIPTTLRATEDGAVRYKQGEADIGVLKEGDNYILHDYTTSKTSKTLTRAEAESALNEIRGIVENGAQSEKMGTVEQENISKSKTLIRPGMTETERYKALKNRNIVVDAKVRTDKIKSVQEKIDFTQDSFDALNFSDKRKLIVKIGDEFGVFDKSYDNADISLTFNYSRNNARESLNKQQHNYYQFVKMLSCFDAVIDNAVGIEVHNRNEEGYKADKTLKNVYVLTSAFEDGDSIVPVKLEVKEFTDKNNALYVAIALESINKDGVVVQEVANDSVAQQVTRPSTISISDFFKKINPSDKSFLKYIPDGFLNTEQKRAKQEALAEDAEKTKSTKKTVSEIVEGETESKVQTVKIDLWAKEHIKEYGSLNALNKSAVRATIRAAQKNKFDEDAIVTFARFASKSGLAVSFDKSKLITGIDEAGNETYANGMLYGNTVYVNPDSKIKHDILLIHELLHELITKKGAEKLIKSAVRNMDKTRQKEITERYLKFYNKKNKNEIPHDVEAIIVDEITAHYAEEVFSDIDVLAYLDEKDPTIKDRIIGFFSKSARAYSEDSKLSATARKFARQYRKLFNEVAERNYQGNSVNAERRYSFAGENAKTADKMKLGTARDMLENGVDSETVRKETGWFKGYDGKWRFEIDDSDVEIAFNGKFSRDPKIKRYAELVEKVYFIADATVAEQNELAALDKELENQKIEPVKLGDMIKHTVLFEAYPQLAEIDIRFLDGLGSTNGMWDAQLNEIVLAKSLKMDKKRAIKTLLHEIQHAIQYHEGFTYGASPEYWVANPIFAEEGNEKLHIAQKKLDDVYKKFRKEWKDDINWHLAKEYKRLQELWWESSDATYYEKKMSEIEEAAKDAGFDDLLDEYLAADAEFEVAKGSAKKIPSHELYLRTAGEIEARDVAGRAALTVEQRKNTRPDIDRTDVVFADGKGEAFSIVELDNGMQYVEATESQVITGTDPVKWANQVAYYINNTIRGGNDFVIKTEQGDFLTITRDTAYKASSRNQIRNPDGTYRLMTDAEYRTKLNASVHINELSQVSKKWNKNNVPDTKNHKFAKNGFSYRTAYFKDFDGKYYRLTISVGENGTVSTVYNVGQIKKDALPNGKIKTIYSGSKANSTSYDNSIPESSKKSNSFSKNSLENISEERYSLPESEDFDSPTLESVAKEREKRKVSWKEKLFSATDSIYIDTVDEMYGVEKYISKYGKNKHAKALVQQARASRSQAQTMIGSVQYDVFAKDVKKIGNGIHQIMKPIRQRGAENVRKFEDYMLHRLNVDRMTLEERSLEWTKADREALEAINGKIAQKEAEMSRLEQEILNLGNSKEDLKLKKELQSKIEALVKQNRKSEREAKQLEARIKDRLLENKPVFGENEKRASAITAEKSREIVAKYEKIHTEWNSIAEEIYSYLRALNHMRVEAGLISEEQEAYMNELYPHYVPAYRDFSYSGVGAVKGSRNLEISSTLRKAKGGGQDITEFERIIAEQTQQLLRAGRINQLANAVYESALASGDTDYVQVVSEGKTEMLSPISPVQSDGVNYSFGVTQKDIDIYVDDAYDNKNTEDYKKYATVSNKLLNDVKNEIDVSEYSHALRDNDIRHINNSHGEGRTNEKYPVTKQDIKSIPLIVQQYDKVIVFQKSSNKIGLMYVKVMNDGLVYYLEQITDRYGNEKLLINKQMIKTGIDDIPDIKGLKDAITKKQSETEFLADLKARQVYAQSVYQSHSANNSISEKSEKINSFDKFSEKFGSQEDIYDAFNRDTEVQQKNKENQITFYKNGEKITMNVSREIFIGFEALNKPTFVSDSAVLNIANKINNGFKKIVTSYSPAFLIRNPMRDIQDAGLNSKHPVLMVKNIPIAFRQMCKNSELWQQYRAYGGWSSTVFDANGFNGEITEKGFNELAKLLDFNGDVSIKGIWEALKKPGKNLLTTIENVNAFIEQITRFSEFLASVEAGDSIETAIYNSAEVTTNFGRRGRITKVLNATFIPFLNPAIQGFDKMFRNVKDAITGEHVARALATLLAKAAAIGILPMLINMLMYGDDEDYEDLREEDKENNFLIKCSNGTFIKIPRGRVASVIGGATNRISRATSGKDADVKGYLKNVVSQVTPIENFSRSILSPFTDIKNNRTWYGTEIEGREFENTSPKDRYDESTSSIAIFIGQAFNYSPKKVHYLLDQYSGVIGDFILPATTKKSEKDFLSGNFTIDPATSNKLSTKFYELYDETQYAKTAGDDTAIYQVKYLNRVKSAISEMYDQISEIQNSELSSAEKLQQTRVIRVLINEAYKTAIQDYELYTKAIEATASIKFDEDMSELSKQNIRFAEATRLMYGAERALKEYDEKVYTEAQLLNKAGLGYDSYYSYYFSVKGLESDKDKNGNTVSGSKRKKVVSAIEALNLSTDEELLLIASHGYSLTDTEKRRLLKYILRKKMTKAEKEELAEKCGFKVKNGKIILK